jgi:hypothetical protein
MAASEIAELIARAMALLKRAEQLATSAMPASLSNQLTVVEATLRDAHVELRRILSGESDTRPSAVKATLDAEAEKLGVLEHQLPHRDAAEAT